MSTDLHALSGAYALDALSAAEADAFCTHLDECAVCRDEVRELREAAAQMAAVESLPAPTALRGRVLAAVDQTSQLPPNVTPLERARKVRAQRRFQPRLLVAAAAAVAAVVFGVTQFDAGQAPVMSASASTVFNASDVHKATVSTSNGGKVVVATSRSLGKMAVETDGLPALTERQVYQLWTVTNGVASSAGVLKDIRDGASMSFPGERTQVAITIEPAGGSQQPTSQPIVTVSPTSV